MNLRFLLSLFEKEDPVELTEFRHKYPQAKKIEIKPNRDAPHLAHDIHTWLRSRRDEDVKKVEYFISTKGNHPPVCLLKYPPATNLHIYDGWHRVAAAVINDHKIEAWVAEV